jgi:hypothetical protein
VSVPNLVRKITGDPLLPPHDPDSTFLGRGSTPLKVALALSRRLSIIEQGCIQSEGTSDAFRADPEIQQ